ncbi:hypothetical protein GGR16_002079 [Chelatococcus caeni]|uniref:Uncharacterized protein n=1 Tax=Chelatococcus caeni TaxID=1348468 RepID=A0A840BVQ2_9HYPH|nr:hypothetical protein [Chelatococcus caeni]MBB4017050.1 hypothetical protein [Chelatococcus caeni]
MTDLHTDARRLARGHALEGDEHFLAAVAAALEVLGPNARRDDVLGEAAARRIREERAQRDEAVDAARRDGAAAERERIRAIMTSAEAEGRRAVAEALAFSSDMPAAAAIEALRSAPKVSAAGWSEPPLTDEQRARAEAALAGRRARDADGGLVAYDSATGEQVAGAVVSGPDEPPKPGASKTKALWKDAIAEVNRAGT